MISWRKVAGWGFGIVLVLWLATPFIVREFAKALGGGANDSGNWGTTGDIFGAITALFNGLAFLSLIVVLVYEMGERKKDLAEVERLAEERHRTMRPFIVPQVPSAGLKLGRAEFDEGEYVCDLIAEFNINNSSEDVALNVQITACLEFGESRTWRNCAPPLILDLPIVADGPSDVRRTFSCRGDEANDLLRTLAGRGHLVIAVEASYVALNDAGWASKARYKLELDVDGPSYVAQIVSKNDEYFIRAGAGGRPVTFTCIVEQGSWVQEKR